MNYDPHLESWKLAAKVTASLIARNKLAFVVTDELEAWQAYFFEKLSPNKQAGIVEKQVTVQDGVQDA